MIGNRSGFQYIEFWKRFLAYLIDLIIVGMVNTLIPFPGMAGIGIGFAVIGKGG